MSWYNEVLYPRGIAPKAVDKEKFDSFAKQFNLAKTYSEVQYAFSNVKSFMDGKWAMAFPPESPEEKHLLPKGYGRYSAIYKDADGFILVLGLPESFDEEKMKKLMHDREWVAVVIDSNRRFYGNYTMCVVTSAKAYRHFNSLGCFNGWSEKILR